MRKSIPLVILLMLASVLAGCLTDDGTVDGPDAGDNGDGSDGGDGGDGGDTGNETEYYAAIDAFTADPTSGEAPVNVTFTWEVDTNDENATWTLDFGDNASESDLLADTNASLVHSYSNGSYEALFTVHYGNEETVQQSVNLTFEAAPDLPEQWTFEYGASLGCFGDLATCISVELGPDQEPIDGFWQELDERYWGLELTVISETALGDTDCTAYDEDQEEIARLNGGAGPCEGALPEGTAWLFVYSYGEPSPSLELQFFEPE